MDSDEEEHANQIGQRSFRGGPDGLRREFRIDLNALFGASPSLYSRSYGIGTMI